MKQVYWMMPFSCNSRHQSTFLHDRKYKFCTKLHFPVPPLYADTVIVSADRDDIQSVLFLASAIPVAFFPPTDWQKPQTAADQKALSRWICWDIVSFSRVGREVTNSAASSEHIRYLLQLSHYFCALGSPMMLLTFWDCSAEASAWFKSCFCFFFFF